MKFRALVSVALLCSVRAQAQVLRAPVGLGAMDLRVGMPSVSLELGAMGRSGWSASPMQLAPCLPGIAAAPALSAVPAPALPGVPVLAYAPDPMIGPESLGFGKDAADEQAGARLNGIFDGDTAPRALVDAPARPIPVAKDPDTSLYGVTASQRSLIVAILKRAYGPDLLDLAALGSRARGKASALKNYRPATTASDLDLAPLLKTHRSDAPDPWQVAKEIQKATGIPVELHGVLSSGETRFGDAVPFYGGGFETWHSFQAGEATRLPLD